MARKKSEYIDLGNPFWSMAIQANGGLRSIGLRGFGFLAACFVGFELIRRSQGPGRMDAAAAIALNWLAWIQPAVLVLWGSIGISQFALRDYQSKMIESHHMAPVSSTQAVLGILLGGCTNALVLWAIGLFCGWFLYVAILSSNAGGWLLGNLQLLLAAAGLWLMQVWAGFGTKRKPTPFVLTLVLASLPFYFSGGLRLIPAPALLFGITPLYTAQGVLSEVGVSPTLEQISLVSSIVLILFWFPAATRRFRRPYLPSLTVIMSLLFVSLCVLWSLVGLEKAAEMYGGAARGDQIDDEYMLGALALHLIPIVGLVLPVPLVASLAARRRVLLGGVHFNAGERIPPLLVALIAAAVPAAGLVFFEVYWSSPDNLQVAVSVAAIFAMALITFGLMRFTTNTMNKPAAGAVIAVLIALAPMAIGIGLLVVQARSGNERGGEAMLMASRDFSPIGTIACVDEKMGATSLVGLGVQGAAVLAALWLGKASESALLNNRARMRAEEQAKFARAPTSDLAAAVDPTAPQPHIST